MTLRLTHRTHKISTELTGYTPLLQVDSLGILFCSPPPTTTVDWQEDTLLWLLGSRVAEKAFVLILTTQKLLYLSSSDMREEAGRTGPGNPVSMYMRSATIKILKFPSYALNIVFKSVGNPTPFIL